MNLSYCRSLFKAHGFTKNLDLSSADDTVWIRASDDYLITEFYYGGFILQKLVLSTDKANHVLYKKEDDKWDAKEFKQLLEKFVVNEEYLKKIKFEKFYDNEEIHL